MCASRSTRITSFTICLYAIGIGSKEGKQKHLASAAEHLRIETGVPLHRTNTLLIDDDMDNVTTAWSNGVKAVHCDPREPHRMVQLLLGIECKRL